MRTAVYREVGSRRTAQPARRNRISSSNSGYRQLAARLDAAAARLAAARRRLA